MNQFTLYVSEKDSREIYPENTAHSFAVQLSKTLFLDGKWVCCIKKVHVNSTGPLHKPLAIHSDFCSENYHFGSNQPVMLDFVLKSETGWQEYEQYCSDSYVEIKNNTLRIIRFKLSGDPTEVISELHLQLHFKRQ